MIYYIKNKIKLEEYMSKRDKEPIMFLNKLLTSAGTRYWPTKLELAGLIWIICKIKHLIETSKNATIFYTNHEAALKIVRQTILFILSRYKLSLKLIKAFNYIQRFNIILKHKPKK